MIQSVDSLKIAKEIGKQSVKKGIVTDVLLEINIGAEESKTGFLTSEFYETVYEISEIKGRRCKIPILRHSAARPTPENPQSYP